MSKIFSYIKVYLLIFLFVICSNISFAQYIFLQSGKQSLCYGNDTELPSLKGFQNYNWYLGSISQTNLLTSNSLTYDVQSSLLDPSKKFSGETLTICIEDPSALGIIKQSYLVTIHPLPVIPELTFETDCENNNTKINISNSYNYGTVNPWFIGPYTITWSGLNNNSVYSDLNYAEIQENTDCKVEIENSFNCKSSTEKYIIHGACSLLVYMPEIMAFTPGATTNNMFCINSDRTMDAFESFKFVIMNKWGDIVHESSEFPGCWDGNKNGNPCGEGVYIWTLQYKGNPEYTTNDKKVLKGIVTLLR